jgi:hypothetical protein
MTTLHVLPLYHLHSPPVHRWSTWLIFGFIFVSIMLALEVMQEPVFYNFFNFNLTVLHSAVDFYKSKSGQTIVNYSKQLATSYMDFRSIRALKDRKQRGDNVVPPFFAWFFQDHPEIIAHFFERLNSVKLNRKCTKISEKILNFVCV